jgi:hypothetical protein
VAEPWRADMLNDDPSRRVSSKPRADLNLHKFKARNGYITGIRARLGKKILAGLATEEEQAKLTEKRRAESHRSYRIAGGCLLEHTATTWKTASCCSPLRCQRLPKDGTFRHSQHGDTRWIP